MSKFIHNLKYLEIRSYINLDKILSKKVILVTTNKNLILSTELLQFRLKTKIEIIGDLL